MHFFQIFKFGTEIIEISQNCCYITKLLNAFELFSSTGCDEGAEASHFHGFNCQLHLWRVLAD